MGQKVHPTGIRLGIVKDWASKWYADTHTFPEYVRTDHQLRVFIKEKLKDASVSRITIERPAKKANITIFTARPMRVGAEGIKVKVSGRLNGAEIARSEWYREGRVPLHTLRADIDYGLAEARTTYGVIGVKVWIFKGEVFDKPEAQKAEAPEAAAGARS